MTTQTTMQRIRSEPTESMPPMPNLRARRSWVRQALRLAPISVVLFVLLSSSASAMLLGPSSLASLANANHSASGVTLPSVGLGKSVPSGVHSPSTNSLPYSTPPTHAPAAAHPAANNSSYVTSGRAQFFSNNPIPNPAAYNNTCRPYPYGGGAYYYCWNTTTEPSLNLTSDGYTGMAYTAFTNQSPCRTMDPNATSEVGFVLSTDFGYTWSSPVYLGNPDCTGSPDANYTSAFQPSLTSLANGTFVLAYVEYNSSSAYFYYSAPPNSLACNYVTNDRIVVTESYDHGTTWTDPTVMTETDVNYSYQYCPINNFPDLRPKLTAIGDTVYLTYFNESDPYQYYANGMYGSGWVHFVVSTDGGQTWGTIQDITPVQGNLYGYPTDMALNPNVMVDPSGKLYLAYATDFGESTVCPSYCYSTGSDAVVVLTSTNNGTSWSGGIVDPTVYMDTSYYYQYPYVFVGPAPDLAYNPTNGQVYMTFAAGEPGNFCQNEGMYGVYCYFTELWSVFFQNSSDGGASWSTPATISPTITNPNNGWYSPSYNPSVAVDSAGRAQLTFAFMNDGSCVNVTTPYPTYYCSPIQEMYANSTDNGTTWTNPISVGTMSTFTYGPYREIWDGTFTSIIAAGSQVLVGWTQVRCPTIMTFGGCYLPMFSIGATLPAPSAEVTASRLYEAAGLTITYNETKAPLNSIWEVNILGNVRFGPAGTNLSISGVPPSSSISWYTPWINVSYGDAFYPTYSVTPPASFAVNSVVKVTFVEQILVGLLTIPTGIQSYIWTCCTNYNINPLPGSFWVTAGTTQTFTVTPVAFPAFCWGCMNMTFLTWTGTGAGSVTSNSTSITFTPTAPVNETANFRFNGVCWTYYYSGCLNATYSTNFQEQGLPAGTQWGVTLTTTNGSAEDLQTSTSLITAAIGTGFTWFQPWTIYDSTSGMFWVPSSTTSSPIAAPVSGTILIDYTLESIGTSSFSTRFQESGLPNATAWSLDLGSTSYGVASTNLSLPLSGGSSYSVNGSFVYLNNGTGYYASSVDIVPFVEGQSEYTIAPGATFTANGSGIVTINYKPMWWVTAAASQGGSVSPDSQWIPNGQSIVFSELAEPGYHFVGWSGSGAGGVTAATPTVTVTPHAAVTEFATFRPNLPPTWNLTVVASGLPAGVPMSLTLGGITYTGASGFKVGNISQGNYSVSAPTVFLNSSQTTRFTASNVGSDLNLSGGTIELESNGTVTVTYATQYLLSVVATPGGSVTSYPCRR